MWQWPVTRETGGRVRKPSSRSINELNQLTDQLTGFQCGSLLTRVGSVGICLSILLMADSYFETLKELNIMTVTYINEV